MRADDFVFVSGQVPIAADGKVVSGGFSEQTDQVLRNIASVLGLAGCERAVNFAGSAERSPSCVSRSA